MRVRISCVLGTHASQFLNAVVVARHLSQTNTRKPPTFLERPNQNMLLVTPPKSLCGTAELSGIFQPDVVVNSVAQLLFAAQVAFGGLDRCVPQQELDLLQFAAGYVA